MRRLISTLLLVLCCAVPAYAQEMPDPEPPAPPTGDCTITRDMIPCDVHVLLNGTVTLGPGVKRSDVRIIPAPGVNVQVVGGDGAWLDLLAPRSAYAAAPLFRAGAQRFRNRVYSGVTGNLATVAAGAFVTNASGAIPWAAFVGRKLTVSDGTNTAVGWVRAVGAGETYGPEKILNGDFAAGVTSWTPNNSTLLSIEGGQVGNCLEMTRTGASPKASQVSTVGAGELLFFSAYFKSGTAGAITNFFYYFSTTMGISATTTGAWVQTNGYKTADRASEPFWVQDSTGVNGNTSLFDELSCKQLLSPSATGCTIVSAKGGSTQSWASTGVNANAASFTMTISAN